MALPGALRAIRLAAPHRAVASLLTGGALALAHGGPLPGGFRALAAAGLLTIVALSALRASTLLRGVTSAGRQSIVLGLAGLAGGGALAVLILTANWPAVAVLVILCLVEWLLFHSPVSIVRGVPVEVGITFAEGGILPALGYAAVTGGWAVPWPLIAATLCVSLASSSSAFVTDSYEGSLAPGPTLRRFVPVTVVVLLSLSALTAAIALVLAGAGPGLDPELALLATPVPVMAAFFAWLSLFDPRPEWRLRRLKGLVTASALSWYAGLLLVLLVATPAPG